MRIVFYAVNGSGVGHLTRLLALAKWVRRYLRFVKVPAEIVFLTSSEETGMLFHEGFPAFKLPSKTVVAGSGLDKTTYLALAKQWVWHSLALLRPDLLVVDSFPRGAFGELLSALDLVKKKAFVSRRMKPDFAGRADFQAMLPLYDRILLPEDAGRHAEELPKGVASRTSRVGPIVLRERCELFSRAEARARLGLPADGPALLVTAGGGGDPTVPARLAALTEKLRGCGELVVAAGPLYRGPRLPGVVWFTEPTLGAYLSAFDVAVSASGYNTFHELLHGGIPTIFLPQEKVADEQDARAVVAAERGAARLAPMLDDALLAARVEAMARELLDPKVAAETRVAAAKMVPKNAASQGALDLLSLVLPAAELDVLASLDAPRLLEQVTAAAIPFEQAAELVQAVTGRTLDRASVAEASLDEILAAVPVKQPEAAAAFLLLGRRLPLDETALRLPVMRSLMAHLAEFADWPGAALYLRTWSAPRGATLATAEADLVDKLTKLRQAKRDFYHGLAELVGSSRAESEEAL